MAVVAREPISAEINPIEDDEHDVSASGKIKKRFSIRRNNQSNNSIPNEQEMKPLIDENKLPKSSRQVAVKICKGKY